MPVPEVVTLLVLSKGRNTTPADLTGAVPAALLIRVVSPDWLIIVAGTLLLIALSVVTIGKRYVPHVEGTVPMAASGVIAGFMNTLAGIAGPAITVYATAARWDQRMYAATLQPIFMVSGAISFLIKEFTGAADLTTVNPAVWGIGVVAMILGISIGVKVAPKIPRDKAYNLALALAVLGGLTAVIRGIIGLVG
ncbi:TSUP family transporter [Corynebacterium sp. S7]